MGDGSASLFDCSFMLVKAWPFWVVGGGWGGAPERLGGLGLPFCRPSFSAAVMIYELALIKTKAEALC